jgi:ribonuclease D
LDKEQTEGMEKRATRSHNGKPNASPNGAAGTVRYVDSPAGMDDLGGALSGACRLALDLEAAGFHRYSDRVCLIQLSLEGETWLLDPLAVDPAPILGPVLENPDVEVVMHGADFDVRMLDRDLGVRLRGLFDTQIAGALLGVDGIGLSALLERTLGVSISKKYQRADWAKRPLPPGMREYAALDTAHLLALSDRLREELRSKERLAWALEECRQLESVRWEPSNEDPVTRVKGARDLTLREIARLRAALEWRDGVAREKDRAHFRVAGNDTLLEAARRNPISVEEVAALPGMNPGLARAQGDRLLDLLREANQVPDEEVSGYPRFRGTPRERPDPEVEERLARLKDVRNERARSLEIDRGTLLPNHILEALADTPPADLAELAAMEGLQEWRVDVLGRELLEALEPNRARV